MIDLSVLSYRGLAGRLARAPLKWVPSGACVRVVQGPLRGAKWIVGSGTHGCWLGWYEAEKQSLIVSLVQEGDVVYDIGANVGFYTLLAGRLVGAAGRVHAFEPVPRNLAYLHKHIAQNGMANTRVWENAVGGRSGTATFSLAGNPSMGHLGADGDGNEITVDVVGIDELVATNQIEPPNVIKCDIEGAEVEFLLGARATVQQHRPTILLATHGREIHRECCQILGGLGYRLRPLGGRRIEESEEVVAEHSWKC